MSQDKHADHRDYARAATGIVLSDGRGNSRIVPPEERKSPRLRVQAIERTAFVRFLDAEILFEEAAVRAVSQQLHRLIQEEGHTRLVVNFAGVRYVSSAVLGILAALQAESEPTRRHITLCGLDPLLRDMVRITHLDRVFDIRTDEADALGLIVR
jgi:anti-anti-sigma factor